MVLPAIGSTRMATITGLRLAALAVLVSVALLLAAAPSHAQTEEETTATDQAVTVEPVARDEAIENRIGRILRATGWYRNLRISVDEGIVFLDGIAGSDDQRLWARDLATRTEGTVAVRSGPGDAPVTVDGRFTGDEWAGAVRLEGLFTDVYVDYRDGRLYFLNDWRANSEGIRRDCFNYFQVRIGEEWIDLRVYGDGRVEATRDGAPAPLSASGAYGFGRSPGNPEPHTIYEFSLAVRGGQFDVCCFDPLTRASCDELAHEPAVISLSRQGSELRVRRSIVPGTVQRLAEGEACGAGEGICEDGLTCEARVCARRPAPRPDAGWPDAGVGDAGPPDPPM